MDDNNRHKNHMNIEYNENAYSHLWPADNGNDNLDILLQKHLIKTKFDLN